MEPNSVVVRAFLGAVLCALAGCSQLFARNEIPATDRIVLGAPRSVVEAELGSPISEVANIQRATGLRECVYKVLVKDPIADGATALDKIRAGMVGFSTFQYRVLYDRNGNVVHADEVKL